MSHVLITIVFSLVVFDLSVFFLFSKDLLKFAPSYKNSYGGGYPKNHFIKNDIRGFDIRPNYQTSTTTKPVELGYYKVWGNEIGCFDDSIKRLKGNFSKKIIYLAGDSFTWGYAPFDKKFGYILEKNSEYNVMKCGVTHTGQIHQFLKFKELYKLEYKPEVVIVNILSNDVQNDFFFPHTTVIDGYLVEDVKWCYLHNNEISWERIEHSYLKKKYLNKNVHRVKSLIKNYSASAHIAIHTINYLKKYTSKKNSKKKINIKKKTECSNFDITPYGHEKYIYSKSDFSLPNRKILKEWIEDSNKNKYELIFAFIGSGNHYEEKQKFIQSLGGKIIIFNEWLKNNSIKEELYWDEGHFNIKGNNVYSSFLIDKLNE